VEALSVEVAGVVESKHTKDPNRLKAFLDSGPLKAFLKMRTEDSSC